MRMLWNSVFHRDRRWRSIENSFAGPPRTGPPHRLAANRRRAPSREHDRPRPARRCPQSGTMQTGPPREPPSRPCRRSRNAATGFELPPSPRARCPRQRVGLRRRSSDRPRRWRRSSRSLDGCGGRRWKRSGCSSGATAAATRSTRLRKLLRPCPGDHEARLCVDRARACRCAAWTNSTVHPCAASAGRTDRTRCTSSGGRPRLTAGPLVHRQLISAAGARHRWESTSSRCGQALLAHPAGDGLTDGDHDTGVTSQSSGEPLARQSVATDDADRRPPQTAATDGGNRRRRHSAGTDGSVRRR